MPRLLLVALFSLALVVPALAKAKGQTWTDPEKAAAEDPDFDVQGEYVIDIDGKRVGVQVVALGQGKFDAVMYRGGLPGAGAKGPMEKGKLVRRDGVVEAEENDGKHMRIEDGKLKAVDAEGKVVAEAQRVVRESPTMGAEPPEGGEGAVVLFEGGEGAEKGSAESWKGGKVDEAGYLQAGATTKQSFGDHTLHLEFRTPYSPQGRGQGRGNSGVYLQKRYEVQVLDSFGLEGKDNEAGGLYKVSAPKVNMALPPLQWQTYDIDFTAARFDESGKKTKNARVTVKHNGVVIQDDVELPDTTGGGDKESPAPGPLYLQQHGDPVVYRNVWVVPKGE